MAYLGNDLQVAFPVYRNIDDISGSFNSATTSFALTVNGVAPVPAPLYSQQCLISVGGVIQRPDDSGTEGFRLSGGNIIFASAPTTGADFFGIILAGADYVDAGANFPSGTAAVPSITFNDDLDTGIYNSGINQLSFTTGGSERLRIDSAGQIEANSIGSASVPTFSFISDPDTGIYSPGANQLAITTSGTGRLFVDAGGNVGINTASPGSVLQVNGAGGIRINEDGVGTKLVQLRSDYASQGPAINVFSNDPLLFLTNNQERLRITSDGKVGVGTSSVSAAYLQTINGDGSSIVGGLSLRNNNTETLTIGNVTAANNVDSEIWNPRNGYLRFATNNQERLRITSAGDIQTASTGQSIYSSRFGNFSSASDMYFTAGSASVVVQTGAANDERLRITSDGKVGIGTQSPGATLTVSGEAAFSRVGINANAINTSSTAQSFIRFQSTGADFYVGTESSAAGAFFPGSTAYAAVIYNANATPLQFYTNGSERLRITSDGKVGIGTQSPSFAVDVSAANDTIVRARTNGNSSAGFIGSTNNGTNNWFLGSRKDPIGGSTGTDRFNLLYDTNTFLTVATDGKVGIGTSSPVTKLQVGTGNTGADTSIVRFGTADANVYALTLTNWTGAGTSYGPKIAFDNSTRSTWVIGGEDGGGSFIFKDVTVGNNERMRIDSSGRLLVGTSTATNNLRIEQSLAVVRTGSGYGGMSLTSYNGTTAFQCPVFDFQRSRGTTDGSLTKVQADDRLGVIAFRGADGATFSDAALIDCYADGEWNTSGDTSDSPGRLVFSTTADGASSPTERMRITSGGFVKASNTGSYIYNVGFFHEFTTSENDTCGLGVKASNASLTIPVIYAETSRASNSAFSFFEGWAVADREFNLRGDGNAFADGTWTGGGADYAEYFEWVDSNTNAEDRRGISVVLDGNKIREALPGEDPIGVISGNPSVVGDAAWNKWSGKYLRDEFGTYIQEDYEIVNEKGETVVQQRRKLNPAYDSDQEYISREERPEWDCVGLMGKLRIRKGQVTGSRWIKMRDISDSVEEWLVR